MTMGFQLKSPVSGRLFPKVFRTEQNALRFREREARKAARDGCDRAVVDRLEVVRVSARRRSRVSA